MKTVELQIELDKANDDLKIANENISNFENKFKTSKEEFDNFIKEKDDEILKANENLFLKDLIIDIGAKDKDYLKFKYESAKGENFKRDDFIEEMKKNKNIVGATIPPTIPNPPSGGNKPATIQYNEYMMLSETDRAKYKPSQINYKGQ